MKTLITYFSASGITRKVAYKIKEYTDADIFEIVPLEKYTTEDLDWTNELSRSSIEMKDVNSRPQVLEKIPNINDYDKIILGFPIWWYKAPTIINTFIEENNFEEKSVYIFVTSGSTNVDNAFKDLKDKYPNINFISGKRFTDSETEEEIRKWIGE